jgi:hypothetical protein
MTVNMELVAIKYNYSKEKNLEEIRMIDRPNLWNLIKCDGLDIKN